MFDPIRAAAYFRQAGDFEEACWLTFLLTHFSKHRVSAWELVRGFYGSLGGDTWSWQRIRGQLSAFRQWLLDNHTELSLRGSFGNHRKYVSLDPHKQAGTLQAVETYVGLIQEAGSHADFFSAARAAAQDDTGVEFEVLFKQLLGVTSFGRMAVFDYLTMIDKLGLEALTPSRAFLRGSTGPLQGARRLFGSGLSISEMEEHLKRLGAALKVNQQVIEDSVCNWQKSPGKYIRFGG